MFERFTDRARRVVVLANEETRLLNHHHIGTEHLLLGLLHEGEGVGCKALEELGLSIETLREAVLASHPEEPGPPAGGHIPFEPEAKRALEMSLREALQLGHNYIGTEHILLGLLRHPDATSNRVLAGLGLDLSRARQTVVRLLSGDAQREAARLALEADELETRRTGLLNELIEIEQERTKLVSPRLPEATKREVWLSNEELADLHWLLARVRRLREVDE